MKKTLIAMAAVAVAGVASAQVTITGKIGYGVKDSSEMAKTMDWTDGGVTFSASEDLGGGMSAAASMSIAGMTNHSASSTGDGASASLSGPFGKIAYASGGSDSDRLGVGSGLAISGNTVFGGTANGIGKFEYTLPTLAEGLTVTARISGTSGDEVGLTDKDVQLRLGYAIGALGITYNTIGGTKPATDMGVTYDAGFAKFAYAADVSITAGTTAGSQGKRSEFSVSIPVTADVTVAMSTGTRKGLTGTPATKDAKATEFNASYALSKRTSINAAYASVTTKADVKQTANTVKIVHSF